MRLGEVSTHALCAELDVLEANVERMAAFFRGRLCRLRPHVKVHKTPAIARLQSAAGCGGFTCATVAEAAVLAAHGFDDLLIANEIVDPTKMPTLRAVVDRARVDVPAKVLSLSDEHTTLAVEDGFTARPGDRVWLRSSHVDPTVNLHDGLYAVRGDEVAHVWPVAARGYRKP